MELSTKASGGDGISVELFQILKDDAGKVLHSMCSCTDHVTAHALMTWLIGH